MFQLINDILTMFRQCFKREKTWNWFVCAVLAFMVRFEWRGVTSVISTLRLKPRLYESLLHFFRSDAYSLTGIYRRWAELVPRFIPLFELREHLILLGDHTKVSKEGRRMPYVRTHHQESENSGKPEFIEGHNYGCLSALATNGTYFRSIPLMAEIQESKIKTGGPSLVEQMVECGGRQSEAMKKPVTLVLDAYFCNGATFVTSDRFVDEKGMRRLEIITRAKSNTVAYTTAPAVNERRGRGRPRKYGDKVEMQSLFDLEADKFVEANIVLYGKKEKVRILLRDLFWKPCQRTIRFVLVELGGSRLILMSSDLALESEDIIKLYGLRFKIETGFNELKNELGGFDYHFWTYALPKKSKWKDHELPTDKKSLLLISRTRQAIEMHVCLTCIASGILTILAFTHNRKIWASFSGWLRTVRTIIPSTATTRQTLRQEFFYSLPNLQNLPTFSCVLSKQRSMDHLYRVVS